MPDRAPAGQRPVRPARPAGPSAPTTSWDVVSIPTGSDEEPPPFDEPMPSDEPDLPPDRGDAFRPTTPPVGAPSAASSEGPAGASPAGAPAASSSIGGRQAGAAPAAPTGAQAAPASAARPGGDPAARPGALRFEGAGEEPAVAAPAPTLGGRARYGEAVVREILGANFIEEQPLPGREG